MASVNVIVILVLAISGLAVGINGAIPTNRPDVIAHRGCSGRYPEMTPISFQRAVDEGADYVECDLAVTRDFHLVCAHESWMSDQTNVASVFPPSRISTYFVDDQGRLITDYFTVDFTLAELNTIGKRQRYNFRDPTHDDLYPASSVEECLQIIQSSNRTVGFLAEIKDPLWVNSLGFMVNASVTVESLLLDVLTSYGYTDSTSPATIQAFNHDTIKGLRPQTQLDLSFLVNSVSETTDEKFAEYLQYADSIGVMKSLIVVPNGNDQVGSRTDVIERAQAAGLSVNVWTFRNEDSYLLWDYGQDIYNEMQDLLNLGTNGFITDFPESAVHFLDSVYNCSSGSK